MSIGEVWMRADQGGCGVIGVGRLELIVVEQRRNRIIDRIALNPQSAAATAASLRWWPVAEPSRGCLSLRIYA